MLNVTYCMVNRFFCDNANYGFEIIVWTNKNNIEQMLITKPNLFVTITTLGKCIRPNIRGKYTVR